MLKKLSVFFSSLLIGTSLANAGIVIPELEELSHNERKGALRLLMNPKHYGEDPVAIKDDFESEFRGKVINPYWVPDTLQQAIECWFSTGSFNQGEPFANHIKKGPRHWHLWEKLEGSEDKKRKIKALKAYQYPNTVESLHNIYPTLLNDWLSINFRTHEFLRTTKYLERGSKATLDRLLENHSYSTNLRAAPCEFQKIFFYLRENKPLLACAIDAEERAHREGKLLLWRYAKLLPGDIPDLPFSLKNGSIKVTLEHPLELRETSVVQGGISYATRLLDGYIGDGRVPEKAICGYNAPACTFSFFANETLLRNKKKDVEPSILYSLALTPEQVVELNSKNHYLYYPKDAMPEPIGIYGTGEGFHSAWITETLKGSPQPFDEESIKAWFEIMSSNALQVHYFKGAWQENPKVTSEANRIRGLYQKFLQKAFPTYTRYFRQILPELGEAFRSYNKSTLTDLQVVRAIFPELEEGDIPDYKIAEEKFSSLAKGGRPYAKLFNPPLFTHTYEDYFRYEFLPQLGEGFRSYNKSTFTDLQVVRV